MRIDNQNSTQSSTGDKAPKTTVTSRVDSLKTRISGQNSALKKFSFQLISGNDLSRLLK